MTTDAPSALRRLRLRAIVYALTCGLAGSGLGWLLAGEAAEFGNRAQEVAAWCRPVHGLLAMLGSIGFGALIAAHVLPKWHERKPRGTGLLTLVTIAVVILTGGLLYYIGHESMREAVKHSHWIAGSVACAALGLHRRPCRRGQATVDPKAQPRHPGAPANDFGAAMSPESAAASAESATSRARS